MKERLAMLMSEANEEGKPAFSDLRRKNTKKAMVSLMATPDDAAVAEIMFDQMTEEDKEKVHWLILAFPDYFSPHFFFLFFSSYSFSSLVASSLIRRKARMRKKMKRRTAATKNSKRCSRLSLA